MARLGQRRETEQRPGWGNRTARLPPPAHPEDHFASDAPKLTFYAAMCFTWLHQTEQAEDHARQVIAQSTEVPVCFAGRPATRSRKSTLRLAAQRDQPDEAARRGISALDSGQRWLHAGMVR